MFKPVRKKVVKTKEKATFKLEFHVTQVPPQRWDKLLVSLVCVDTGKTTCKTAKLPVKNGTCQWPEPLLESIFISQDSNGKDVINESYKFVVSTGLSRLGLVGDATINFMDYFQSTQPVSLSLPLQNCNVGSILHVKLQRMLSKSASRDNCEQKDSLYQSPSAVTSEAERASEVDSLPSANNNACVKENSAQADIGDSMDAPSTPIMEEPPLHGRDDDEFMSLNSSDSSSGRLETSGGVYNGEVMSPGALFDPVDPSSSSQKSGAPQISLSDLHALQNGDGVSPIRSSSKAGYEDKSKWETSQRWTRLKRESVALSSTCERDGNEGAVAEIEALRQQLATETKRSEEVNKKLSKLIEERDSIKQEMESLKFMELNFRDGGSKRMEEEASRQILKELQDELDYVKGMNVNLSLQLDKTQESNSELLLEIQDLEMELETQRSERENKSARIEDHDTDLKKVADSLRKKLAELEGDTQSLTEENLQLLSQLKPANDKLEYKDETIANLKSVKDNSNICDDACMRNGSHSDCGLREKLRESEEARILLEKQSQSFLDRAIKFENDHSNAMGIIKNLEAAREMLEQEKDETIQALRNQLSAMSGLYDEQSQLIQDMKVEKANFEIKVAEILRSGEVERADLCQLQSVNTELEEKLRQEQLNASKLMQQCKLAEANLLNHQNESNVLQAQIKLMQQKITEVESSRKDLTGELHGLLEKERTCLSRIKDLEVQTATLEKETESFRVANALLEAELQELKSPKDTNWSKPLKTGVEENLSHFEDPNAKSVRRPLEERNTETTEHLQKQVSDLLRRLLEKDVELQDVRTKGFYLEEELQRKVNALISAERRLKDQRESLSLDGASQVSYLTRSLSRANSRIGANKPTIAPTREAKELSDLRSKVKLLESEVKKKAAEVEASKEQMKEHRAQLLARIEQLELANEELALEHSNSKLERALKELNSLQSQNGILCQRENDLLSKLAFQDALQCEVDNLKEENRELKDAFSKVNATAKGENIFKRMSTLETELAEVLESNLMYKTQLQSVFSKQQNVHAAALENLGSVDKVIKDLAELKRKNMSLQDELCDMKERYFSMSLQFAEVEAEREELVMSIRNLRGTKKFVPLRSAIF